MKRLITCTGDADKYLPPDGDARRAEILSMVKTVTTWRANQCGRRPGAVHNYLLKVADNIGDNLSFDQLVIHLRIRLLRGNDADMILDDVDIGDEYVTWCEPGKDCKAMPFSTLRNKWSRVRKIKLAKS